LDLLIFIDLHHKILENYLRPNQRNQFEPKKQKIVLEASSKEINLLIKSYNRMVEELEISAIKLAQSEREEAWREMAKQVAHEIKTR
jgi:nitrogen fixation/metabolism regulation signal transduction histidine kinase